MSESIRSRTGILLVNLGTPDAPTAPAIRRYLREFLSDQRVVELPRLLWWPILYGFILPLRPRKLAHAYGSVWTPEGSPLLAIGRAQQRALQDAFGTQAEVLLAMRYGNPGIAAALEAFETQDIRRVIVLPLYPQYSATTTASVLDEVFAQLARRRRLPELRTVNSYHDDAGYIAALAESVHSHWQRHGRGDRLLMSFHSIPQRCIDLGDPYRLHCESTAALLARALDLQPDEWTLSFQSRIGRAQWVSPYTDEVVLKLAAEGVRRLDAICPGFSADCLETLEEVALRYAEDFRIAGGEALRYVPALNAESAHIEALAALVRRHAGEWLEPEGANGENTRPA